MNKYLINVYADPTKFQRYTLIAGMGLIVLLSLISIAFAAPAASTSVGTAIQDGVKDGTASLYSIMTAIVLPIAAVSLAWNGFKVIFGGERGMETAKKNMLTLVLVLALVYLAPLLIEQVGGWFKGASDSSDVFN